MSNERTEEKIKRGTSTRIISLLYTENEEPRDEITKLINEAPPAEISRKSTILNGETPLHAAVKKRSVQTITLLLCAMADATVVDFDKLTALDYAVIEKQPQIIRLFESNGYNFLEHAVLRNNVELIRNNIAYYLRYKAEKKEAIPTKKIFDLALEKGYTECIKILLEHFLEKPKAFNIPNFYRSVQENFPLHTLIKIINQLTDTDPLLSIKYKAEQVLDQEFTLITIKDSSNLTTTIEIPLIGSWLRYSHSGLKKQTIMIDENTMRKRDFEKNTVLHYAAKLIIEPLFLFLFNQPGIDYNSVNSNLENPLHIGIRENKNLTCIKILANQPFNRFTKNRNKQTPVDLINTISNPEEQKKIKELFLRKNRLTTSELPYLKSEHHLETSFSALNIQLNSSDFNLKLSYRTVLLGLELKLHTNLLQLGLEERYDKNLALLNEEDFQVLHYINALEHAENKNINLEPPYILQCLYETCLGELKNNKYYQISLKKIHKRTIGLLAYYSPLQILKGLIFLAPYFHNHQHLIAQIVVKEMIWLSDDFHYSLTSKGFKEIFDFYLKNNCHQETAAILRETLGTYSKYKNKSLVSVRNIQISSENKINITDYISKICNATSKISKNEVSFIGTEFIKITIDLCKYSGLSQRLSKDKAFETFNAMIGAIPTFVVKTITEQGSEKSRAKAIRLFALVADFCLNFPSIPDFMASLNITAGLVNFRLKNLKETQKKLKKDTRAIIDELEKLILPSEKYKEYKKYVRKLPSPSYFIPFLAPTLNILYTIGEFDFIPGNIYPLGKALKPLVNIKKITEFTQLVEQSDLSKQIKSLIEKKTSLDNITLPTEFKKHTLSRRSGFFYSSASLDKKDDKESEHKKGNN